MGLTTTCSTTDGHVAAYIVPSLDAVDLVTANASQRARHPYEEGRQVLSVNWSRVTGQPDPARRLGFDATLRAAQGRIAERFGLASDL